MATPASSTNLPFGLAEIEAAARRIEGAVVRTPTLYSRVLSERFGADIWVKFENLQHTGAYKERGALNKLLLMDEAMRARGVIAASAGNHAQALAYHARRLGVPAVIVMPTPTPIVKVSQTEGHGAEVVLHGAVFEEAYAEARRLADERGLTFVHPFDDLDVMAGQGTMALEILEQAPHLDTLVVPVGGGGLLAGMATAVKALRPDVQLVAAEPAAAASFLAAQRAGAPVAVSVSSTLADGLAVARVGARTFAQAAPLVDAAVTVTEDELATAIALLARHAGVVAEGAGATALAAVLAGKVQTRRVVVPVCGRNIEPRVHARILSSTTSAAVPLAA